MLQRIMASKACWDDVVLSVSRQIIGKMQLSAGIVEVSYNELLFATRYVAKVMRMLPKCTDNESLQLFN